MKKHIIKIAPLVRLPIARTQVFSYISPEPIARGSLVEIPFFNRYIWGIALESRDDFPRKGGFVLKPVKKVIREKCVTEKQIELAEKIAAHYLCPLGIVLRPMVPKMAKKAKRKKTGNSKPESIEISKSAKEILSAKEKEIALVGAKGERDEIVISFAKHTIKQKKQLLFLASEVFSAAATFSKLKKYFPEKDIALMHGNVAGGEFFENWEKVKNGQAKIIVSTKLGVYLPFCDLGAVFVEESGDISHKQWDASPRYDAVRVARMLAEIHSAKIVLSNALPSVEIWKEAKEKNMRVINANSGQETEIEIKIADIFREKKSADFPIGKELYSSLANVVSKKKKALLIVNRKGFSSYSVCQTCKAVLRCPHCDRALVYFDEKERYECLHCAVKNDLLSSCPSCGSVRFSHQGIGIQLVEKKAKRLFPTARISRIDADVLKSRKKMEEILEKTSAGDFDVLVGTQIILKIGSLRKFYLVAFPDFNGLGSLPEFNAREIVFSMLGQAKDLVEKNGELLVQTSRRDDFLLDSFQKSDSAGFLDKELKARKKTNNPPFARLVKLTFRDKSRKKVETETKNVFGLLSNLADSSMNVGEPYNPFAPKKRGYYCQNILLKTKPDADLRRSPIFSVVSGLKKGWTVDVEPVSII
jgi:primosomal protein N' (replication factor Y)